MLTDPIPLAADLHTTRPNMQAGVTGHRALRLDYQQRKKLSGQTIGVDP